MLNPHIHRVRSFGIEFTTFSVKFAHHMLFFWLNHGNATTARSLLLRTPTPGSFVTIGEDHESGKRILQSENSKGILRSLNNLNLSGAMFPWDSGAYHGLVDLRLYCFGGDARISTSQIASILAASPALVVLKLAYLTVTRTDGRNEPSPVFMDCLKELRLIGIDSDSLALILPLIAFPESRDDLSVGLPPVRDAHAALKAFFLRTRVKSLHFYPPAGPGSGSGSSMVLPYWVFLPPVGDLLLIQRFAMGSQSIWNNPNGPLLPVGSRIPVIARSRAKP
ncbi:hypothetical protein FRC07_005529 [Ceratobasidium sp. 392]|nr:hypothetical protein FRC07_005529 [Ceratobasidium sp. 392]